MSAATCVLRPTKIHTKANTAHTGAEAIIGDSCALALVCLSVHPCTSMPSLCVCPCIYLNAFPLCIHCLLQCVPSLHVVCVPQCFPSMHTMCVPQSVHLHAVCYLSVSFYILCVYLSAFPLYMLCVTSVCPSTYCVCTSVCSLCACLSASVCACLWVRNSIVSMCIFLCVPWYILVCVYFILLLHWAYS